MAEDVDVDALLGIKTFVSPVDAAQWLTRGLVIPLMRIAGSDASRAQRRREMAALIGKWEAFAKEPES